MQIDFKNFDYKLIATRLDPFDKLPFVEIGNSDVKFNCTATQKPDGMLIDVFSNISVPSKDNKEIRVYKAMSRYFIPYQQSTSRMVDKLDEVDESVFTELVIKHLAQQTQHIYSDNNGYIIDTPSIRDIYSLIQQMGDTMNN